MKILQGPIESFSQQVLWLAWFVWLTWPGVLWLHKTDKAAEDTEFKLEFDAVYHWFESSLDNKIVQVFEYQEDNVHHDDQGIDGEKLVHNPAFHDVAVTARGRHAKDFDRVGDI